MTTTPELDAEELKALHVRNAKAFEEKPKVRIRYKNIAEEKQVVELINLYAIFTKYEKYLYDCYTAEGYDTNPILVRLFIYSFKTAEEHAEFEKMVYCSEYDAVYRTWIRTSNRKIV